jgi:HAE1 family hydrophobic/amphiphilic exporter-1/multidrug efflux pump
VARYFIDRPIFAAVLSILLTLAGLLAVVDLPVAQYPKITPPTIRVTASYPGASATVIEQTVAGPLEQQINGVEHMLYMNSTSSNDGKYTLTITFAVGTNQDTAAVEVQNRIAIASNSLPEEVKRLGITVTKQSTDLLALIALTSPTGRFDNIFLSNFASLNLVDAMARVPGVGSVTVFGARDYGMRIWVDPGRMERLGVTAGDISAALKEQNVQAPAGQVGLPPAPSHVEMQYPVQVRGRLSDPAEYENIVVRARPDGSLIYLRDVARVELAAADYSASSRLSGKPAAMIGIYQTPTANALEVVDNVRKRLDELSRTFPDDVRYEVALDTTQFVRESLDEVVKTLFEALVLVMVVVYLFLQSWRATLIPMLVVPVSLIGTFAAFTLLGFSINTLTLFAMVLAIGIVVDDAIVVVEAAQEQLERSNPWKEITPREAAHLAMEEVSGPVIAIALVLTSVFVPVAFLGGITGQLYKQFALTLSISVLLSAFCALTLTPALCALLLRREHKPERGFFAAFNRGFARFQNYYSATVLRAIRRSALVLATLAAMGLATFGLLRALPTGFVPNEDLGYALGIIQLPDGAALQRSQRVVDDASGQARAVDGVRNVVEITGVNIAAGVSAGNFASLFAIMQPWDERADDEQQIGAVLAQFTQRFDRIKEALVRTFNPSPIPGLGASGGFDFMLQDRHGGEIDEFNRVAEQLLSEAGKEPAIDGIFTSFRATTPQIEVEVDREKVKTLGVSLAEVFSALQTFLGGAYINDFNLYGRTYKVMLQADAAYRSTPDDINEYYVRTNSGHMVPLRTLVTMHDIVGPTFTQRYNLYRTIAISGHAAPGYSSGEAMAAMERVAARVLPNGYGYEWTGVALQEKQSGGESGRIFVLALIFAFLFLAALYESWSVPFAVLLIVPVAVFGAYSGQWLRGLDNNVYAQIGLIMLMGLAAKNAILIVEFAKAAHARGQSIVAAARSAALLRLRPILMTSFAFILGVLPLVFASGAGSAARVALGTSVVSGMLVATLLGIVMTPVFYVIIQRLSALRHPLRNRAEDYAGIEDAEAVEDKR